MESIKAVSVGTLEVKVDRRSAQGSDLVCGEFLSPLDLASEESLGATKLWIHKIAKTFPNEKKKDKDTNSSLANKNESFRVKNTK